MFIYFPSQDPTFSMSTFMTSVWLFIAATCSAVETVLFLLVDQIPVLAYQHVG